MSKIADATFAGASGTKYGFTAYTTDTDFENIGAVYIFTKRTVPNGKGSHKFLYIGETGELKDRISDHEKWPCVERNDCNAICVHAEGDGAERLKIEKDLLDDSNTPCNL